jgi:NADPH-dependent 2,4-dienoyl-CoA reductase/sulfur reductase-like enzyme
MRRHYQVQEVTAIEARSPYQDRADIVIVGNGIAGLTSALEARSIAPEKHIVIITEQSHPTIHTPALKQFATGKLTQEQLLAFPAGTERTQQIEMINARVEEIKSRGKFVCLNDGQAFGYSSLLLATGSKPNGLLASVPGRNFDGVIALHRLNDYLDLRRRLRLHEVSEAVVVGGGTHAIENVMTLLQRGIRVHWLIRNATFLPRMLDRTASEMALEHIRRAGARVYTETEVVGIIGRAGTVAGVVTNHQQTLPCQLVLVCTGTMPVTTLAERCDVPLKHKQGILVDDHLRTNIPDIYAAGDVAALRNPQTGVYEPRAHWQTAALQGRVAAAVMTGRQELASAFGVPWHATRLGELSLLNVGDPFDGSEGAATLTDNRRGSYRRLSIRDERLTGYLALGTTQSDSLAIKRIIDEGLPIRDIENALLTGEFDAGHYFSRRHSHAAHKMAVTGKLALPDTTIPVLQSSPVTVTTRDTGPMLPVPMLRVQLDMRDDEDPLQKRVEKQAPAISSVKSLMSKQLDTMRWIVPAILPEGLVVLAGKQKVGKSSLGMSIGLGIAGLAAIRGVVLESVGVEKGNVLYLALEDSERTLQERLGKLRVSGTSLPDEFEYATGWPCMDDAGLTNIEEWLVSRPHARLVIIDSWVNVQPGMQQRAGVSGQDAEYEAFKALRELAHAYNVCILVTFHAGKGTTDNLIDEATKASLSAMACADGMLHLKRARNNKDATLYGAGIAYMHGLDLALSFNDGRWETSENAAVRAPGTLPRARRAIIDLLHENDRPMKPKEIALALGKLDGTIRKMLFEMKASRLIKETEQGYVALVTRDGDTIRNSNNDIEDDASSSNRGNGRGYRHTQNAPKNQRTLPTPGRRVIEIDSFWERSEDLSVTTVSNV